MSGHTQLKSVTSAWRPDDRAVGLSAAGVDAKKCRRAACLRTRALQPGAASPREPRHLIRKVKLGMQVYDQEISWPVLVCVGVDTSDEETKLVDSSQFGNGTAISTRSGSAARKFVDDIEPGQVGVNVPIPVPLPMFSSTGNNKSILGDLNLYGKAGVNFYTQLKSVTSAWRPENYVERLSTAGVDAQ